MTTGHALRYGSTFSQRERSADGVLATSLVVGRASTV